VGSELSLKRVKREQRERKRQAAIGAYPPPNHPKKVVAVSYSRWRYA
jgi:hypothetical protein